MQNLGITLELGGKIRCPAFGLCCCPVEHSTNGTYCVGFLSLAYQPKSRERSARPTKHVTLALSRQKSAYPARTQELDDDEDDKSRVHSDRTTVSEDEDEDDQFLVQTAPREKR